MKKIPKKIICVWHHIEFANKMHRTKSTEKTVLDPTPTKIKQKIRKVAQRKSEGKIVKKFVDLVSRSPARETLILTI